MAWTEFHWPPRPKSSPPVIDMTLEGDFRPPPASPVAGRVLGIAILIAAMAGAIGLAALALYLAILLIPIAVGAGLIAYGAYRWQVWRAGRGSLGGQRDLFRP